MVPFMVSPPIVSSFFGMADWFRTKEPAAVAAGSLFELAHGCSLGEMTRNDAALGSVLNDSVAADSRLFLEVIVLVEGHIFRGLNSLVDVGGGGHGAAAQVIARAFPRIKCTVLDLPHSPPVTCLSRFHLRMLSYSRYILIMSCSCTRTRHTLFFRIVLVALSIAN
jgi:hypothetical protein